MQGARKVKKQKKASKLEIGRPERAKLTPEKSVRRMQEFTQRRRNLSPLSEKARIEVYVRDRSKTTYRDLLEALDQEFTYTFGGATIVRGLDGNYCSRHGLRMQDRVNLLYTHTPFAFENNLEWISGYTDELQDAAFEALEKRRF